MAISINCCDDGYSVTGSITIIIVMTDHWTLYLNVILGIVLLNERKQIKHNL